MHSTSTEYSSFSLITDDIFVSYCCLFLLSSQEKTPLDLCLLINAYIYIYIPMSQSDLLRWWFPGHLPNEGTSPGKKRMKWRKKSPRDFRDKMVGEH